mgnify:CR=1 FL=1
MNEKSQVKGLCHPRLASSQILSLISLQIPKATRELISEALFDVLIRVRPVTDAPSEYAEFEILLSACLTIRIADAGFLCYDAQLAAVDVGPVFEVVNSDWFEQVCASSAEAQYFSSVRHFVVVTSRIVLEVLVTQDPVIV